MERDNQYDIRGAEILMTRISLTPDAATMRAIDKQLGKLAVIGRNSALRSAMRQGGNVIKKEWRALVPVVGKHKGATPLRNTIKTAVHPLRKGAGFFVKVHTEKPTAHLVELGHKQKGTTTPIKGQFRQMGDTAQETGTVEGKHYGQIAKDRKFNEAQAAIINGLKKAVADATK